MVVSILGCGWYGSALAVSLIQKGHTVKGSVTCAEKLNSLATMGIAPFLVQFEVDKEDFDPDFFDCDVLVISIPPKLRKREGIGYVTKLDRIIKHIIQFKIKKVIYIGSTGVYGDHNSEVDERSDPRPDTASGAILLQAEQLFQKEKGFETAIIRFAGLIGPGRHPGRFFAGKTDIPNGLAPINLIHLTDCLGITAAIIEKDAFGHVFTACTPAHPPKEDFYREAALKAGLPLPQFIHELAGYKVVNSKNIPDILSYQFLVSDWKHYLANNEV